MPIVAISVKRLNDLLGKEYEMDRLVNALEQLGCDVEDTTELALYECPACRTPNDKLAHEEPPKRCDFCGYESEEPLTKFAVEDVIRLDLLADRPDLFDAGGLSRALKGYLLHEQGLADFPVKDGNIKVTVDPDMSEKKSYRPYIVCAVVRVPALDNDRLREIMKLQENLHWGIGRDRKLSSIGVYDLDTLAPDIRYSCVDPETFKFVPLGMPDVEMTPKEILADHPKGKAYAHLMDPYEKYPILLDSNDQVLAMPPIINSDETKCTVGSTNLFIDVTGISEDAVVNSLNTLTSALLALGGMVENVEMVYPDRTVRTPDLTTRTIDIKYEEAVRWLGLDFTRDEFMGYLRKMRLNVEPKGDVYEVSYPAFRTDIRHEVDVFEDLAIGYGYENIKPELVPTFTVSKAREEEQLSQLVRQAMVGLGFTEVMSLHLMSIERHFDRFLLEPGDEHVIVENPKTIEQKISRAHMMTGIMEVFQKNRRKVMPLRIFELGNIIKTNPEMETGVNEYRHLSFGIMGPEAGYAEGRKVLDAVMRELQFEGVYAPVSAPTFMEGRLAEVTGDNGLWARVGEMHPKVLNNFSLTYPVTYCELRLIKVI